MMRPQLDTVCREGVTMLGDARHPGGVAFGFTERKGGCSRGQYASLNLGDACGDDVSLVIENRRRALRALDASLNPEQLINPHQVHGDHIVFIRSNEESAVRVARREARQGADGVISTAAGVSVLLCFADCVPVVLVAPGAFAVVHSGWRGTLACIAGKALRALTNEVGCAAGDVLAYIGPHIAGPDYEVSEELLARFKRRFGTSVCAGGRHLDLARAIGIALEEEGLAAEQLLDCGISTPRATDRFYSYRAEGGHCGRHGAIACLLPDDIGEGE